MQNVEVWRQDAVFVVDELERLNDRTSNHLLAGQLDLSKLGIFGHSFGGATAGEAIYSDERFDAGVNMDGTPFGKALGNPLGKPFMFVRAAREPVNKLLLTTTKMTVEEYEATMDKHEASGIEMVQNGNPGYLVTFEQMRHFNFTDLPYIKKLIPMNELVVGDFDSIEGGELINGVVRAFFDKHLLGKDVEVPTQAILDHPLVEVRSF